MGIRPRAHFELDDIVGDAARILRDTEACRKEVEWRVNARRPAASVLTLKIHEIKVEPNIGAPNGSKKAVPRALSASSSVRNAVSHNGHSARPIASANERGASASTASSSAARHGTLLNQIHRRHLLRFTLTLKLGRPTSGKSQLAMSGWLKANSSGYDRVKGTIRVAGTTLHELHDARTRFAHSFGGNFELHNNGRISCYLISECGTTFQ
ncbi:hypothetical protein DFH09DRAFT_1093946 [Mycena vulgaris]|nr:hypothetical protein DFH09DRAFT_1093946 [Mycena vulgaris]